MLPKSSSSSLVVKTDVYRGLSEFYLITSKGTTFANGRFPGQYTPYLAHAKSYLAGEPINGSIEGREPRLNHDDVRNTLRALIYAHEDETFLALVRKILKGDPLLHASDTNPNPGQETEALKPAAFASLGEFYVLRGEDDTARTVYTALPVSGSDDQRVEQLAGAYIHALTADEQRECWTNADKMKTIRERAAHEVSLLPSARRNEGISWELLAAEYVHQWKFEKARAAYARAAELLAPFDEENITVGIAQYTGTMTREEYYERFPSSSRVIQIQVKLKELDNHEPD